MTELSTVSIFLVDKFKSQPLVNTISFEKTGEIDANKNNIYPLVNIDIVDTDPIGDILTFNYVITILQQRDIDNELNNDKILNKDNMIDNLNECYAIATRCVNNIERNENEYDIEILRKSNITLLKDFNTQKLDGVRFNLSLSIQNNTPC